MIYPRNSIISIPAQLRASWETVRLYTDQIGMTDEQQTDCREETYRTYNIRMNIYIYIYLSKEI